MNLAHLTVLRWEPVTRPPHRLSITCVGCPAAALNADRHLRGWQQTTRAPRFYRCPDCAADSAPEGDAA